MRFMTIECSRSVHSIVLRMAQVNSNVFYKCYKYKKGGLFCQEVCVEQLSKSWRSQGGEEILEAVHAEYQKTKAKQ